MPRTLPQISVDNDTYAKFSACVHCGLCLPACPTYVETLDEADSPRGRIHLMRSLVDGRLEPSPQVLEHLDRCLVCRACETACPSGVVYHDLIETVRPQVARAVTGRPVDNPLLGWLIRHVLPFPKRAALSMFPLRLARKLGLGTLVARTGRWLPAPLGDMAAVLPEGPVLASRPASFTAAIGERRGSVLLLLGCLGSEVSHDLNRAAVTVLARNGFDVHLLPTEPCCGALAAHANAPESAAEFARQLVDRVHDRPDDYVVSPIAGCGAQLKALPHVLHGTGGAADRARAVSRKVRDITEFLTEVGLRPPTGRIETTVTYHDPCHLLHAQRVADAPRQLLRQIPGVKLVPLPESDICCGAAGTYNLAQPEMAAGLGRRKADHIVSTGAAAVATANVGCQLQIQRHLDARGASIPVGHVVELLARSYELGSAVKTPSPAHG